MAMRGLVILASLGGLMVASPRPVSIIVECVPWLLVLQEDVDARSLPPLGREGGSLEGEQREAGTP